MNESNMADLFGLDGRGGRYLRSGELQYFRVHPDLWRPALDQMRAAGFNAISTYIPWIVHEPREGTFDFTGESAPSANLIGFLDACREVGLPVMARPGPQIYAEFEGFGLPLWLGRDHPECVMRNPRGGLVKGSYYYFYSLLHPTYLAAVERWYERVIATLWPTYGDLIVSFQLDNETGMPFGNTLGNFDFNPDTVARYQQFLRERYDGEVARLNTAWRAHHTSFDAVRPPTRPTSTAAATAWYEFFEDLVVRYLTALRAMAERLAVPVPLVLNDLDLNLSPGAPGRKHGLAAIQGYDIYTKASSASTTADFPFAPSNDPERWQAYLTPDTRLISVEMGAGWFDPRARIAPAATVQATLGGVAHGIKGHSYYVAHDGRDPSGAPYHFHTFFTEDGRPTERLRAVARMHSFLAEHERDLCLSEATYDPILYLTYQPYARLMPGDYLPGGLLPDPLLYLESLGLQGFYDVLLLAGFLPRFADLEMVSDEELARARVVCFPSKGWVSAEAFAKLQRYVAGGGHLLTFPTPIAHDTDGNPLPGVDALYPGPVTATRHLGYPTIARRLATDLFGKYLLWERWRLARSEPTAMQNMDSFEGLKVLLNQPLPVARLQAKDGHMLRGDYVVTTFSPLPYDDGSVQSELALGSQCAGYRVELEGGGTSTVLGSVLGGAYTTGVYYRLAPEERTALHSYARALLGRHGLTPSWRSTMELEVVARRVPGHAGAAGDVFVFVFNRLGRQEGVLRIERPSLHGGHIVSVWTSAGSSAILAANGDLQLVVAPDDVLVLRITRP